MAIADKLRELGQNLYWALFLENYDINVARHLVQGVDAWLNTPRRPLEASGTSGQKVAVNGGLNISTLDGWWAQAYDGGNGFAIGRGGEHSNLDYQDQADIQALYSVLENEAVPLFYDRDADGEAFVMDVVDAVDRMDRVDRAGPACVQVVHVVRAVPYYGCRE